MTRHLIKLFWHRKRVNVPILLEIFISFLVLFIVCLLSLEQWQRYRKPLGFAYKNVYTVDLDLTAGVAAIGKENNDITRCRTLLAELKALPEVVSDAAITPLPYGASNFVTTFQWQNRDYDAQICEVSDDAFAVMQTGIIQGRGFEEGDDLLDWKPVVINRRMAEALFPNGDAIGKTDDQGKRRIVGVIEDFRYSGEFSVPRNFYFTRTSLNVIPEKARMPIQSIAIRVRPGTTAAFEEKAAKLIEQILPGSNARINELERCRSQYLRNELSKTLAAWLIAGFLMIMVVLGMVGVFWLSITRRAEEIGLRRAMGSTRAVVCKQLLIEITILTAVGIALASLLIVQIPLLGLYESLSWPTTIMSLLISSLFMYILAIISGLYPAWLASRVQPAQALHYE